MSTSIIACLMIIEVHTVAHANDTLSCHLGHTVNTALLRSRSAVDKRGLLALLPFLGLANCAADCVDALCKLTTVLHNTRNVGHRLTANR